MKMKNLTSASHFLTHVYITFAHLKTSFHMHARKLRPIMLAGTGSDVGKSVMAAGLCRIFRQDGYTPAPFKAQNMALNSYATPDGLEIGRAQTVQAEAAGLPPHTDMNPLLLKPQSDTTCQVVLNGRAEGSKDAYSSFRSEGRDRLRRAVCDAFDRLAARYNPIVMEGAGSISEINLRDVDIVNMPMARHADAAVILVADIDRGGVFASAYGSVMLQRPEDRRMIRGIIVNKFRGDMRLFDSGVKMMEDLCGVPVLGVVPYFKDIYIEAEDNLELGMKERIAANDGRVNVAVILLRHLSNFTDFDALERDPRIHLFYTDSPKDVAGADIIILPGSKNTIADLAGLRRSGMAGALTEARRDGKTLLGICGGYQMMGAYVDDPCHIEGDVSRMPGLGLLPVITRMDGEKTTRQVEFTFADGTGGTMRGYEIHNGVTSPAGDGRPSPLCIKSDGTADGWQADDRCMGTYIHGILDNGAFVDRLLEPYAGKTAQKHGEDDWVKFKESQYDLLADHIRRHVDMNKIYEIMAI